MRVFNVVPPGMVFEPSDVEILSDYLLKLIDNNGNVKAVLGDQFSDLIQVSNVYSHKPSFYFSSNDESYDPLGKGNKRFVYSPREKIARKKYDGRRSKRTVTVHGSKAKGDVGFWRSSKGDRAVLDDRGRVLGFCNMLNFFEYINDDGGKKKSRKDASTKKTIYIMYEYRLAGEKFQESTICNIKDKNNIDLRRRQEKDQCEEKLDNDEKSFEELMNLIEAEVPDEKLQLEDCLDKKSDNGGSEEATMEADEEGLGITVKELEEYYINLPDE